MKILVYVDPGSRGEWALAPSVDLASRLASKIVLLTTEKSTEEDPTLLDRAAEKFAGREGLVVEKKVRPGPPRKAILQESTESHPAITVFPPAGRWSLARAFQGSRVKTVVEEAPSTVMVARKPVSDHIRRILVTVSGGPMTETLVRSAQEIAQGVKAELTVLHVSSDVSIPFGTPRKQKSRSGQSLQELIESLSTPESQLRFVVRDGMVIREIFDECEEGNQDVLILGQHLADRETGGPLSANLAEILALECPIPVIIVRPRIWATGATAG